MTEKSALDAATLVHHPDSLKIIAAGIDGPEGPAISPDGTLFVVSAARGSVLAVDPAGGVREHANTGGRPNGLAFDGSGVMYITDAVRKAVLRISESGRVETFADTYEGSPLEGPNDLAFLPDGSLVFSDPRRVPLPDPAISPVFRVTPDGTVEQFASELAFPNGVALAASDEELFVSEMRAHRIVGYTLGDDMSATGQRLVRRFREPASPDGMAIDADGRILVALPGLQAIAIVGTRNELLELYHVAHWRPSNLCFGGDDHRTVFVTSESDRSVYSFRHESPGRRL